MAICDMLRTGLPSNSPCCCELHVFVRLAGPLRADGTGFVTLGHPISALPEERGRYATADTRN